MSDDDPFGPVTEDELDAARVQIRDNAPARIFLQWGGDCDVTMVYGEPYADEVTWSINRIYEGDIEYVRASRYREAVRLLRKLRNTASGLGAFEWEVREAIGNTNWATLSSRVDEADAFLAEEEVSNER